MHRQEQGYQKKRKTMCDVCGHTFDLSVTCCVSCCHYYTHNFEGLFGHVVC